MSLNSLGVIKMPQTDSTMPDSETYTRTKTDSNGNSYLCSEDIFDKDSNLIQRKAYDETGKLKHFSYMEYDENGNNTKWYDDLDGDEMADIIYNYSYYDNGELKLEQIDTDADGKIDKEFTHENEKAKEEQKAKDQETFEKEHPVLNFITGLFS